MVLDIFNALALVVEVLNIKLLFVAIGWANDCFRFDATNWDLLSFLFCLLIGNILKDDQRSKCKSVNGFFDSNY